MARFPGGSRWLKAPFGAPCVKVACKDGWRSRASCRQLVSPQKDRDRGWPRLGVRRLADDWRKQLADRMDSTPDVTFILTAFAGDGVVGFWRPSAITRWGLICGMAPGMRGVREMDQSRAGYLCKRVLNLVSGVLRSGGDFLVRIFRGEGFDAYLKEVRQRLERKLVRKSPPWCACMRGAVSAGTRLL